ncbi:hypothetical protein BH10PSE7_BH10PSE7_15610 [soil metagenome]
MTDFTGFIGRAKRIEDIDLPRIGHEIGVGEDELHAFMDVEAAGSGFDKHGRPKILFEPHIFYRELNGAKLERAISAGLAYQKWGAKPYPSDSYPRLTAAMEIDIDAAIRSASWGLTQIMGGHHRTIGFEIPGEMVLAFMDDEDNHLEATIELIVSMGIDDELRALAALKRPTIASDCAVVARVWNGAGYKKNNYDGKIATSHNRWRGIRDTPWQPETGGTPRRNRLELMTPAELSIREAILAVEKLSGDTRLTAAVVLLGQAQNKVSDFVDHIGG